MIDVLGETPFRDLTDAVLDPRERPLFIAGNVPMRTEIAPLLVLVHLEEYDYVGAAIVATGLLVASVGILLLFQSGERRLTAHGRRS